MNIKELLFFFLKKEFTSVLTICTWVFFEWPWFMWNIAHSLNRYIRHPGYTGFFIWSIGIHMMLCNPVWTIGYALVTWRFFEKRIRYPYIFPLIWIFSLLLSLFSSRKSVILPLIRWNCYFVSIVMIDASFLSLTSLEKDTRNSSCDSSFIRATKSMQREYLLDYLS